MFSAESQSSKNQRPNAPSQHFLYFLLGAPYQWLQQKQHQQDCHEGHRSGAAQNKNHRHKNSIMKSNGKFDSPPPSVTQVRPKASKSVGAVSRPGVGQITRLDTHSCTEDGNNNNNQRAPPLKESKKLPKTASQDFRITLRNHSQPKNKVNTMVMPCSNQKRSREIIQPDRPSWLHKPGGRNVGEVHRWIEVKMRRNIPCGHHRDQWHVQYSSNKANPRWIRINHNQ